MIKFIYIILLFIISYETIPDPVLPSNSYDLYLPMKKDHKYGDDICYYREDDQKSTFYIYYVKPCEAGKYCQKEITGQPFGYCVDLPTNPSTISGWKESCESDSDCQDGLTCENSECNKPTGFCPNSILYQKFLTTFSCRANDEKIDDNLCEKKEYTYAATTNIPSLQKTIYGNFPGLPNKCGLITFKPINIKSTNENGDLVDDIQYIEESKAWCTIGSVPDNEFVDDAKYCYSGFTLEFYPNKLQKEPGKYNTHSSQNKLCVTPISVDIKNEQVNNNCIITYKILDQNEKQYNYNKDSRNSGTCSETIVIESERYREFIDAFKEANEEDKRNCYDITTYKYRCKNSKLIKLWYFYKHPEDYLFYKDRDKLKTVLDFKIQVEFPTYAFTQYLNNNYLLLLLFLIIM